MTITVNCWRRRKEEEETARNSISDKNTGRKKKYGGVYTQVYLGDDIYYWQLFSKVKS